MFFKIWTHHHSAILLCVCYRPQWQGREPIEYLHTHLDDLLQQHTCEHVIIIGDMNQHLVARSFDDFLTVYGLTNQVDFPTHISGSSHDPVISDLPDSVVTCSPLGAVGSSDHMAILNTIQVAAQRDAPITRTNWLWGRADWDGLCDALQQTPWSIILVNDVDTQVHTFTRTLLELQKKYVPNQTYTAKPLDKPWFGYQCRMAANEKSRAWRLYSRHPTHPNKERYRHACAAMKEIQQWAQRRWQDDLKIKLSGRSVGNKSWWTTLKQQQGLRTDDTIPPLFKSDGTVATKNKDKAEVLQTVISWGRRWQVDLAPEKTQAMLISRRQRPPDTPIPTILLGGRPVPLQTSISILGVEVNSVLTFTDHIRTIARKSAWKLSCVRRVSHLLDSQGITTLYAAQVRSLMEYAPLTWSSCPPSYLSLLHKVQARAQRLIRLKALQHQLLPPLQPLQQRRDVAGLCVVYKTHKQHVPHLAALRQPWTRPHDHTTRTAATRDHQLFVPFARTETSLRSFLPRYTRMWNRMVQQTQLHSTSSLQTFKSAVNAWIKQP
ncbi:hypothetical protein GWK47_009008 [Chionoecetes opilio]|uniref:Endonuclease/exonuclease/phosphatase domain-containing protein n=1 Tax=Chionoecetes opilio TaxID=41210 RepID=A0A8J4XYU7_CHIOP|nr:hypothetical protein GWK47_009008 [Chionoecetes opilio]